MVTLVSPVAGTNTGDFDGTQISFHTGVLNGTIFRADDWVPAGFFQYQTSAWPYARFNASGSELTSDRVTGNAHTTGLPAGTQQLMWSDGSVWDTTATRYSGTLAANRITWTVGPPWDVVSLRGGTAVAPRGRC